MTSSFAFIPRVVKKKNLSVSNHAGSLRLQERIFNPPGSSESVKKVEDGAGTKPFQPASNIASQKDLLDLAQLVCLALSDYAIWGDVDLRRKIDWGNEQDPYDHDTQLVHDTSIDDKGYVPLAYLLRHSPVFRLASSSSSSIMNQPQTTFTKAIRTHASHLFDVRLIIPSSSSSTFPRNNTSQWTEPHIQTGYELRRKKISSTLGKKEWDALTIYVENIPNKHRNMPGIIRFVNGLLSPSSSFSVSRIQNICLPPHHQDQPNSIPTCKAFALITLSQYEDVDALLKAWPWEHPTDAMNSHRAIEPSANVNTKNKEENKELSEEEISPFQVEAATFGLRVLPKTKWEELRAEYLLYRQELVDEINTFQNEGVYYGGDSGGKRRYVDETHDQEEQMTEEDSQSYKNATNNLVGTAGIHPNSSYPPGCLVFVRNVHADTNKTTLRSLFLHARELGIDSEMEEDDDGFDYLDYTKGMDCCHVRLRTPLHAQQLVHYLSSNPIVQLSGLDASATSFAHLSSNEDDIRLKPIMAEQVLGKREEIYWEKVPEKIRRQAVENALFLPHSSDSCHAGSAPIGGPSEAGAKGNKRKLEDQTHSVDFSIHAHSAYPPGCLVFIRNVYSETSKTILRNLFLHAWKEEVERGGDSGEKEDEDGIDYLDYTKGMDCCHVRLRTSMHAQQLVHHLSSNPIVQTTGLDASGSRLAHQAASESDNRVKDKSLQLKPLVAEQVLGKREEVYWEKVPEKVRRLAVLSFLHDRSDYVSEDSKPKKRRKNGQQAT